MFSSLYVRGIRIKQIEEDSYYKYLPAIKYIMDMDELQFNSNVTFLVGENGIGKSTLIEAIAVAMGFNPERMSYMMLAIDIREMNDTILI